jgi:hypothetical protein
MLGGARAADIVAEPFPPAKFTNLYIELDAKERETSIRSNFVTWYATVSNRPRSPYSYSSRRDYPPPIIPLA